MATDEPEPTPAADRPRLGVVFYVSVALSVTFIVFGLAMPVAYATSGAVDVADVAGQSKSVVTFEVLGTLPFPQIATVAAVLVLALLFITSADSASFMLGSSTSGGSMKPPRPLRLMWSFGAAFAAVLLLSGGTDSLEGAAVVAGVPFTVILVALGAALLPGGHELLDAHDRHQHVGQGQAHAPVSVRLHDHERSGLGDGEVGARHGDLGVQELLSQVLPGRRGERGRVIGEVVGGRVARMPHTVPEYLPDLRAVAVDRGHQDVCRQVVGGLHDQLGEVGLPAVDIPAALSASLSPIS